MTTDNSKRRRGFGLAVIALCVPLVATYEGTVLHRHADPIGIPSICMGETDKAVVMMERLSTAQCTAVLGASLMQHAQDVAVCVNRETKPHEAAAILSWSYNVGAGAACSSTLIRKLNAGAPPIEWCAELKRWTYAGGKQLPGLIRRRDAEFRMCTTGNWQ